MMTDPIADMLTRIRNASVVKKAEVVVPYSKIKMAIANILVKEGYLAKAEKISESKPAIVLILKYSGREPSLHHIQRISTPGHRYYVKKDQIGKVLNGYGLAILSTPKGVMTSAEALAASVGGEVICEVY